MEAAIRLLAKAQQCRRLANDIGNQKDPAVRKLLALARHFEREAETHIDDKEGDET
jgi:hypothetical protein